MRAFCAILGLWLAVGLPVAAQGHGCSSEALPEAARNAVSLRHRLHEVAVPELDPKVPTGVAAQLRQFKDALTDAAQAAFACAPATATPDEIQKTLADALHANLSDAAETVVVTRDRKDRGAYGSDLAVQVLPLFDSPRYYEVDFRYGVECGDDNLLLVFGTGDPARAGTQAGSSHGDAGLWHEVLRWDARDYKNVSDAFGDFVLLTPLSGYPGQRNWRFVVAHGEPACTAASEQGHFDLDVLEPTDDPAQPRLVWHFQRPYVRSEVPRLLTTEDTLTFQLNPPEKVPSKTKPAKEAEAAGGASGSSKAAGESYRFRITRDNRVEPLQGAADSGTPQPGASTSSPQSTPSTEPH